MKDDEFNFGLLVPDDEKVLKLFKSIRWSNGVYCPICSSKNVIKHGFVGKIELQRYTCKECEKHFNDLTGTIFADKRIQLGESFYIITQLDKKSIKRLSEELGRKWETVNNLAKDFKKCLENNTKDPLLQGKIEIDEMYIYAGDKGIKKTNHEKEEKNNEEEAHIKQTNHP